MIVFVVLFFVNWLVFSFLSTTWHHSRCREDYETLCKAEQYDESFKVFLLERKKFSYRPAFLDDWNAKKQFVYYLWFVVSFPVPFIVVVLFSVFSPDTLISR